LLPGETLDAPYDAFVKIQHMYSLWTVLDLSVSIQVHESKRRGITIPNEHDIRCMKPTAYVIDVQKHVARTHINLVKLSEGDWPVHNDVGQQVQRLVNVNRHLTFPFSV
jgi:hypothetical protein